MSVPHVYRVSCGSILDGSSRRFFYRLALKKQTFSVNLARAQRRTQGRGLNEYPLAFRTVAEGSRRDVRKFSSWLGF